MVRGRCPREQIKEVLAKQQRNLSPPKVWEIEIVRCGGRSGRRNTPNRSSSRWKNAATPWIGLRTIGPGSQSNECRLHRHHSRQARSGAPHPSSKLSRRHTDNGQDGDVAATQSPRPAKPQLRRSSSSQPGLLLLLLAVPQHRNVQADTPGGSETPANSGG